MSEKEILQLILEKVNHIADKVDDHAERIAVVETRSKGCMTILGFIGTTSIAIMGWFFKTKL
jgi:hypothetical protein